jgi:hypothetical protein
MNAVNAVNAVNAGIAGNDLPLFTVHGSSFLLASN